VAPPDVAIELAESIYAELFGLEERDGERRSLFDYFHGRCTLVGWLRAVLAQRLVDRARSSRRVEQLRDDRAETAAAGAPAYDPDRPRYVTLVRRALASALSSLVPRDRLRLALYYTDQMRLAACGRVLGESEATVSRKLERTRRDLRRAIEDRLRRQDGLSEAEIAACFDYGRSDGSFDLGAALPGSVSQAERRQQSVPGQPVEAPAEPAVPAVQDSGAESFLVRGGSE
jgi:RNA polymerase sigma factor (sigma-70 family)